jgi:hypothetical protein
VQKAVNDVLGGLAPPPPPPAQTHTPPGPATITESATVKTSKAVYPYPHGTKRETVIPHSLPDGQEDNSRLFKSLQRNRAGFVPPPSRASLACMLSTKAVTWPHFGHLT